MRLALLALVFALASCGDPEPRVAAGYPPSEGARVVERSALEDELYDEHGLLRESDAVVAGLRLPRGLELRFEDERRHVFHTKVPTKALLRYFGPRVITGEVTELGEGAVYRNGVPRGVRGGVVRMDVAIRPTNKGAQVEILELPPMPTNPPPASELSKVLGQQRLQ